MQFHVIFFSPDEKISEGRYMDLGTEHFEVINLMLLILAHFKGLKFAAH